MDYKCHLFSFEEFTLSQKCHMLYQVKSNMHMGQLVGQNHLGWAPSQRQGKC